MTQDQPLYQQNIDGVLEQSVGAHGLQPDVFSAFLAKTKPALNNIIQAAQDGGLPILSVWRERADLDACAPVVKHLKAGARDVVIFGTGGSSLGAQALAQITGYRTAGHVTPDDVPRVHFFDNLDADGLAAAFENLDLKTTKFLTVSKSGGTAETMMQMLTAVDAVGRDLGASALAKHFAVITEPAGNPLRRLAEKHGMAVLDHNPMIGGRFSVLSNVGLLPALLMGLDAGAVREGAGEALQPILDGAAPETCAPAIGAALSVALAEAKGKTSTVLMPYAERLDLFAMWHRQLWAESLGKGGAGTTPIRALGPVDQHSQLQLYLDGPNDKLHTLIMTRTAGAGPRVPESLSADPKLDYLAGRTIGDLVDAEQRATAAALVNNNRPVRVFTIDRVNERAMGALMMHFILETMIAAHLLGVDAFDQPAVEEGKILARQYLSEM